jgi:hypothetical protein
MFDPNDYNEPEESKLSSEPDWCLRDDVSPLTTVKAFARAMRIAQRANDAAELGAAQPVVAAMENVTEEWEAA